MLSRSLLLVTICVSLDLAAGRSCPFGFVGYRSSCYLFSHEGADYAGAHALCDYFSSRLARITSFDEELFLRGYLKRNGDGDGYYVDGTDLRVEGVWTWDKPYGRMTYLNWYPGEPNSGNAENCLVLWRGYGYRLADYKCSNSRYICETKRKQ